MQDEKDKKPYDRSNSTRRTIRFDDDLLEQIDSVIGDEPFSSWVKTACRNELERLGVKPKS
ncbi:YlcI/YnfO family protein [Moellerella wisconsensis]|uniref:YlcI/YnfO family protein n=1 Tax=Moellerella wisconsensis TaxID=158849 RepID=UPI003076478E